MSLTKWRVGRKSFGALCLSLILTVTVSAQPEKSISNKDTYSWMFGTSWILTDDDGESFNPFLFENLHSHLFPTQLNIDKFIYNGWSAECVLTYSKYNQEKVTNGSTGISGSMFSMDFHGKYSLYKLLNAGVIDPYVVSGLGLSLRNNNDTSARSLSPTFNFGLGLNFWITKQIGIQMRSTAKIGLTDFLKSSDYMQHSIGVVLRFEQLDKANKSFNKSKYKVSKKRKKIKYGGKKKGRKDT
jgi:hypothetical protein